MAFSETTREEALKKAGYKCEKCGKKLTLHSCEAHHKTSVQVGGQDCLSNCQILCHDCHVKTRTYGQH